MTFDRLPAAIKRVSALRRVPLLQESRLRSEFGGEGDVCVFQLPRDASPITVEAPTGRIMALAPGDIFLATPGYRESRRWAVGGIPDGGLVPDTDYWVLADCGVVGQLISHSSSEMGHLGRVRYLGVVLGEHGQTLNLRQFAVTHSGEADHRAPVYLILGTSSEVGKTTAGVAVLRALRQQGQANVIALKATGTSSFMEIARYLDFGAIEAFDCVDFGLPTTYPAGRAGISEFFSEALAFCLSQPADAVVIECAGDPFVASAPEFLACLKKRRPHPKIVLAASDALSAMGAQRALAEIRLTIGLITGPCTDTPAMRQRTEALCGIPAMNLLGGLGHGAQSSLPASLELADATASERPKQRRSAHQGERRRGRTNRPDAKSQTAARPDSP